MPTRIDKLTSEQEARFAEWRDKWIAVGLKTGEADWKTFDKAVKIAYEKAGLAQPKVIVRVQSPIVGAFAAPIASKLINERLKKRDDAVDGAVGGAVRDAVGDAVGGAVRDAVGGAVRGAVDGAVRGAVDGAVDGAVCGAVGDAVRDAVGDAVGGAVRGAVDGAVGGAVDGAVGDAVGDAVDGAVDDAVDGAVDGAVCDAVGDAVRDAVGDAVGGAVRGAVDGAVRDAVGEVESGWANRLGGQFWVGGWWGSPSYVSFFTEVCGLELSDDIQERATVYQDTAESACWWWPYTNFVMVCNRPSAIRRDDNGQLHSDQEMAIEWPDGWGFHALHGVRFDKNPKLWKKIVNQDMTLEEIAKGSMSADQNAVAIQMLRPDRLLKQVNAKLINTGQKGTKLYEVPNFMNTGRTEYCMWMKDASTDREFIEWTPPEIGKRADADLCQAEAFGIPKEDYLLMTAEA